MFLISLENFHSRVTKKNKKEKILTKNKKKITPIWKIV